MFRGCRTVCADMRNICFEPAKFDAVTAVYSLFHVPKTDHRPLFDNIFRCLKPAGRFLFTYATKQYTGQDSFEGYRDFLGEQLFYSHKTPRSFLPI